MEKKNNFFAILGIVIGIVAIIIGAYFISDFTSDDSFYSYYSSLGKITFGADYYTESYKAMAFTGNAVAALYEVTCYGFGSILIVAGTVIVVCFASKLKKNVRSVKIEQEVNEYGR